MFRIMIAGKTFGELKTNVALFLKEMSSEEIKAEVDRQLPLTSYVAPPQIIPELPTVTPYSPPPPALTLVSTQPLNGERDSSGLPWDERIHSTTKGTNKDGTWRTRRGVEPSLIGTIEDELKARVVITPKVDVLPSVPLSQPAPLVNAPIATPVLAPPVLAPPVLAPPPPPMPSAAHSLDTFKANLVMTLANLVREGKLTQEYINSLKTYFNVDQIWLANDQQLAEMFENFVQAGILTKVG